MRFDIEVRGGIGGLLAVALLTGMASTAHAQNPQDILKKMDAAYKAATSFQGTVTTMVSGKDQTGKSVSATRTQAIRYKSPNKMRIDVIQTTSGVASAQMKKAGKQIIVSDGKTALLYSMGVKQYMKIPLRPQLSLVELLSLQLPPTIPGATLQAPSSVNGRAAFVIKITPIPPTAAQMAQLTPEQKKMAEMQIKQAKPTVLMIDKQNYHLLKVERGAGAIRSVTTYTNALNVSLPDSVFAFTLPAGSKEVKPPPQQPGGGAPMPPGSPR